jgi:hypothetical protein
MHAVFARDRTDRHARAQLGLREGQGALRGRPRLARRSFGAAILSAGSDPDKDDALARADRRSEKMPVAATVMSQPSRAPPGPDSRGLGGPPIRRSPRAGAYASFQGCHRFIDSLDNVVCTLFDFLDHAAFDFRDRIVCSAFCWLLGFFRLEGSLL